MFLKKIFFPIKYKILIVKKLKNIFVCAYNSSKIAKLLIQNNNIINFDSSTNTLNLLCPNPSIIKTKTINAFNKLLFSFENYFSKKIKFKGKGFRLKIKKDKKIIKFLFGHSHLNIIFLKNIKLKKSSKYKFILKNVNITKLNLILHKICSIKPVNVFTNRGIRISRQIIFKRKGKKGSYT